MALSLRRSRAFTLVELLVVIGIIALLISILLPTLNAVRSSADQAKCSANLKTMGQLLFTYAAENKGSLPYGIIGVNINKDTGAWLAPTDEFYSWAGMAGKYATRNSIGDNSDTNFPPFQLCPTALKQTKEDHILSYVANMIAFPDTEIEGPSFGKLAINPIPSPAKIEDLLPFTGLVWDTAVAPDLSSNNIGYVVGVDVDLQYFWSPDVPQIRYYDKEDAWQRYTGLLGALSQERPIQFDATWRNNDKPALGGSQIWWQGNVRFRHGSRETVCNMLMGDGSVQAWAAKLKKMPDGKFSYVSSDLKRKNFMTRWPSNIKGNPSRLP